MPPAAPRQTPARQRASRLAVECCLEHCQGSAFFTSRLALLHLVIHHHSCHHHPRFTRMGSLTTEEPLVVFVTGASSGNGRAIAMAFAAGGAQVVCADLTPQNPVSLVHAPGPSAPSVGGQCMLFRMGDGPMQEDKVTDVQSTSHFPPTGRGGANSQSHHSEWSCPCHLCNPGCGQGQ